jgi:hypothetical protein
MIWTSLLPQSIQPQPRLGSAAFTLQLPGQGVKSATSHGFCDAVTRAHDPLSKRLAQKSLVEFSSAVTSKIPC